MSHGPSTLGTMITDNRSPISVTSVVRSSSTHGLSSALTRVHSAVSPRSTSLPARTRPARAASLFSTGIASSRLPRRMSAFCARSGSLPTIFSLEVSKKWIIRDGLTGTSRTGSGAPTARGLAKSRGFLMGRGTLQTHFGRGRRLGAHVASHHLHRGLGEVRVERDGRVRGNHELVVADVGVQRGVEDALLGDLTREHDPVAVLAAQQIVDGGLEERGVPCLPDEGVLVLGLDRLDELRVISSQ